MTTKHAAQSTIFTASFILGGVNLLNLIRIGYGYDPLPIDEGQAISITTFAGALYIGWQRFRKSHKELHLWRK